MSFLGTLGKIGSVVADFIPGGGIVKTAIRVGSSLLDKPVVKVAASTALATTATTALTKYTGGGSVSTLPALPGISSTAVSTLPKTGGIIPGWRGPGNKLQLPWNDPRIPEYLKQFALDDAYLKVYYRAPKGYVVVKDANGRAFAVNKVIARQFGIWRPARKPPITATEWKHYQSAQRIEKKLKKIAAKACRPRRPAARAYASASAGAGARAGSKK